jgi:hypothetical protein
MSKYAPLATRVNSWIFYSGASLGDALARS